MNEYQESLLRSRDEKRVLRHVKEAAYAGRQFHTHKIAELWWRESVMNDATVPEPVWALLLLEVRRMRRATQCSSALVCEVIQRLRASRQACGGYVMLTRSTPIKRTGFKSRAPQAQISDPERVRCMPTVNPGAFRLPEPVASAPAAQVAKAAPVRSEAYRRAVASLPCAICGIFGYSQAAHANQGKGMGLKACDLTCFPACGPRPGIQGCHAALDHGALFPKALRRALEPVWAADAQRRILAMGLWPAGLPNPNQERNERHEADEPCMTRGSKP